MTDANSSCCDLAAVDCCTLRFLLRFLVGLPSSTVDCMVETRGHNLRDIRYDSIYSYSFDGIEVVLQAM